MISVIIPVYNTERYIKRCLDSLLSQNQKDFELILVDDGSTDQSGTICDEYASRDSRIKVFHKNNGGVSSARNVGLDNVSGDWIAFVDADDYVDEDYLTIPKMYESCDVVQKGYRRVYEGKNKMSSLVSRPKGIISNQKDLDRFFVNYHTYALWNKLFKSTLLKGCTFNTEISIGEDFLYFLNFYRKIERYAFTDIGCYYYLDREGTSMELFRRDICYRLKIEFNNLRHIQCILINKKDKNVLNGFIYGTYVPLFVKCKKVLDSEQMAELHHLIKEVKYDNLKILNCKNLLKCIIMIMIYKCS